MSDLHQEEQIRQSVEHIADRASKNAVRETLQLIGIDVSDPIAAQAQFAFLRAMSNPDVVKDLAFIRRVRTAGEAVTDSSWRTVTKVLLTAALGGLAIATKDWWGSHIANLFTLR